MPINIAYCDYFQEAASIQKSEWNNKILVKVGSTVPNFGD